MTAITVPTAIDDTRQAPTALAVFRANCRAEWTKLRSVRSTTWTLLAAVGIAVG